MTDFYPLISGAVAQLPENTAAARQALYARVRDMLMKQLRSADPLISEAEIDREGRALEAAIGRVEADAGAPARAAGSAPAPMPMPMPLPAPPKVAPPARAGAARRMAVGLVATVTVACVLAAAYFAYARFWSPAGNASIAVVPAGDGALAIKGFLADYGGAASKPSDVLLLHVRCGATVVERDAQSNPANPAGDLDDQGRFSIAAKKAYLSGIIKVGVHATTGSPDDLHQDFLVLGFFAGEQLELLTGPDGKPIRISPQGEILNAGALHMSPALMPALIVTRRADGNIYASGGTFAFDEAC